MPGWKRKVRNTINHLLSPVGFELVRQGQGDYVKSFLPLNLTLKKASEAKLSLGDYIDTTYQRPGATQASIDELVELGILNNKVRSICEIGPGSGRYLEKVLRICTPETYEIYESAPEWSDWLEGQYRVRAHEADGRSLRQTASESVDLVHAHKVFVYLAAVVSFQYFSEMIRVTRPGGHIVFDIVSESCMDDATIEKWVARRSYYANMMPRDFVISFFARRRCSLNASFFAPLGAGQSEYLVFVNNGA